MANYFQLITVISILFHYYGINGNSITQVTEEIDKVGPIFYFQRKDILLYTDEKVNGALMKYDLKTNKTKRIYIKELANEKIVTVTPTKNNPNQLVIGSDLNLRLYLETGSGYNITQPQVTFNEPGFVIYAARADQKGTLITLLVSTDPNNKTAKVYIVENKRIRLARILENKPRDFRFNHDCSRLYLIYNHNRRITFLTWDLKSSTLGQNFTQEFNKDDHSELEHHVLKSVVLDRDPGNLWVIASGTTGYLLEINVNNMALVSITPLPSKDVTFVTFGNQDYMSLFIGSKMTCNKDKGQGSIYSVTGDRQGATDKPVKW